MFLYYKVTNIKDLIITVVESLMKKEEYVKDSVIKNGSKLILF